MKLTTGKKIAYGIGAVGKDMVYALSANYVLYYYQDMEESEIAEALGIARSSVSDRLRRARERLRAELKGGDDDG